MCVQATVLRVSSSWTSTLPKQPPVLNLVKYTMILISLYSYLIFLFQLFPWKYQNRCPHNQLKQAYPAIALQPAPPANALCSTPPEHRRTYVLIHAGGLPVKYVANYTTCHITLNHLPDALASDVARARPISKSPNTHNRHGNKSVTCQRDKKEVRRLNQVSKSSASFCFVHGQPGMRHLWRNEYINKSHTPNNSTNP